MKAKFNRSALQEALSLVTSVVPARTPKPILRCLQIVCEKDSARLSATDLEAAIDCRIAQVEVDQPGEVVIPADRITAIVRESVDEVISLDASEATCQITGADSHFTIYGHEPGQYPQIPVFEGKPDIEVGLARLQEGIEQSLFAAARESTRYAINGVLWEIKDKKLSLVATDGRRLAKCIVTLDAVDGDKLTTDRFIMPAKAMALLDKIGDSGDEKVSCRIVDNKIILSCGQVVISSNLVEGNFPKYEEIIPSDYDKKLTLSTDAVLSAVRRAALLVSEESKGIKLSLKKGSLVFSSRSPEAGDAQIDMAVDYAGEPVEVGFNPQFLIDVLRVIKADEFELLLGEADRPGLIKTGTNFLYLVMPVNLG